MKHKRDDGPEKQEDGAVDVTPVMICVFVVMCCSMLVLLYYFYDHLGAGWRGRAGRGGRGRAGRGCSSGALTTRSPCSLRDHRDLLPGLLHRPLQLPGALCAPPALLRVQVSPGPAWPGQQPPGGPGPRLSPGLQTGLLSRPHRLGPESPGPGAEVFTG